jgi:hypothetical protein
LQHRLASRPERRIDAALQLIAQRVFVILPMGIDAIGLRAKFRAVIDQHIGLARPPAETQVPLWRAIAVEINARPASRALERRERYKIMFNVQGATFSLRPGLLEQSVNTKGWRRNANDAPAPFQRPLPSRRLSFV